MFSPISCNPVLAVVMKWAELELSPSLSFKIVITAEGDGLAFIEGREHFPLEEQLFTP